jgi:hypothetical protein
MTAPIFTTPSGKPLKPGHHLARNSRGKFMLRLTVEGERRRFVGERMTLQLRTSDPATAMAKRDAVIEAFKLVGILCRDVVLVENVNQNLPLTESTDCQNLEYP